jgi:hypothetical protein
MVLCVAGGWLPGVCAAADPGTLVATTQSLGATLNRTTLIKWTRND